MDLTHCSGDLPAARLAIGSPAGVAINGRFGMNYQGPEVYPPTAWMDQCKSLVRDDHVWALISHPETGWQWLEAWDSGLTPTQSVGCALLDVLAPEVGASHVLT